MTDYTKYIPILAAVITASVGIYVWRGKRTKDPKDAFLVFISQQRVRINTILHSPGGQDFIVFYRESKNDIAAPIARVRPFLSCCKQSRIDALWKEYHQIPEQEMGNEYESATFRAISKIDPQPGDIEQPSKRLLRYMKEFEDVAK